MLSFFPATSVEARAAPRGHRGFFALQLEHSANIVSFDDCAYPANRSIKARARTRTRKGGVVCVERLGLRGRHLAIIIGSSEASVSRMQHGRGLDPESKEGELALLFLRLYRSLDALVRRRRRQGAIVAARRQ